MGIHKAAVRMAKDYVQDIEACTENLANASMPGYKRIGVQHASFAAALNQQVESKVVVDHAQGALRETGRPLDLGIEGEGYFVLSDGDQEYYTRNGSFRLAADGTVVNSTGLKLQTQSGDLRIPRENSASEIFIDDKRNVQLNERTVGQLKIVFGTPDELIRVGNTLFMSQEELRGEGEGTVMSGYLEQSNSTLVDEMVTMMTTLRNYEACQKMLRTVDEIEERMIGKLS